MKSTHMIYLSFIAIVLVFILNAYVNNKNLKIEMAKQQEQNKIETERMVSFYNNQIENLHFLNCELAKKTKEAQDYLKEEQDHSAYVESLLKEEIAQLQADYDNCYKPIAEIPLDEETQYWLMDCANEFDLEPALILAVIESEGGFEDDNYFSQFIGPMAVSVGMNKYLTEQIGLGSLYDFKENIRGGCFFLKQYYDDYGDWNMALVAYNCGPIEAERSCFSHGYYSSPYSRLVLERQEKWQKVLEGEKIR